MTARRGLTLMEVVIGTLLVGLVLAGTLELVGPTVRSSRLAGEQLTARALADQMSDEIAVMPYQDPTAHAGLIGPEAGESGANRSRFDDVDDYHGWTSTPQAADGTAIAGLSGAWSIGCSVAWVRAGAPTVVESAESGVKRVTVSVTLNGTELARRVFLRTSGFDLARAE